MKKKKLEKFLDVNTTGDQLDKLMKEIVQKKFDNELKSKYSKILAEKLDVHRSNSQVKTIALWKRYKVAGIIILLVGVLFGAYFSMNSWNNNGDKVQQYLAQNQLLFQGATRNDSDTLNQNKSTAYLAFNREAYDEYLRIMSTVPEILPEDRFFTAYAKMMEKNYSEALKEFEQFCSDLKPEQKFYEEAHLYKAICLLKTNEKNFFEYYKSLDEESWIKNELNKMQ